MHIHKSFSTVTVYRSFVNKTVWDWLSAYKRQGRSKLSGISYNVVIIISITILNFETVLLCSPSCPGTDHASDDYAPSQGGHDHITIRLPLLES